MIPQQNSDLSLPKHPKHIQPSLSPPKPEFSRSISPQGRVSSTTSSTSNMRSTKAERLKSRLAGARQSSSSPRLPAELCNVNYRTSEHSRLDDLYHLCRCSDCLTSGQQIYFTKRARQESSEPTQRKAVSFRSCVEHIGTPAVGGNEGKDFSFASDNLRPMDCSTPNGELSQTLQPGEQLVRVEVHKPAARDGPDYTCLCAPDFNCIHNRMRVQGRPNWAPEQTDPKRLLGGQKGAINNELYGRLESNVNGPNFSMASDCQGCHNLSTFVNLSATQAPTEPEAAKQQVCGLPSAQEASKHQQAALDQYLSVAARRLQQSIEDCAICHEQMRLSQTRHQQPDQGRGPTECSCAAGSQPSEQPANSTNNSSRSYHTALSSNPAISTYMVPRYNQSEPPRLGGDDATESGLRVLPIAETSTQADSGKLGFTANPGRSSSIANVFEMRDTAKSGNIINNNADSSLSSLFVYRHLSDDNQASSPPVSFEPDSLEVANKIKVTPATNATKRGSASWLKARPKSEYISLSSTTSSISNGGSNANKQQSRTSSGARNNLAQSSSSGCLKVDPDLSQSSLAKRRQLNKQQQQQQLANRRKLLSSNSKSRSSPNVAQLASIGDGRQKSKSFYQCIKNHLLDRGKSSAGQQKDLNTGPDKRASLSTNTSSTLPREFNSKIRSSSNKAAQVCILSSILVLYMSLVHPQLSRSYLEL